MATCSSDEECDDGTFCNGVEVCSPDGMCVDGDEPCMEGQTCNESADRCATMCDISGDADGDGHDSVECGGDDCDDSDPNRFPANTEVCDPDGHDEDCDPSTFGDTDADGDGYVSNTCCNTDSSGSERCGTDCNDDDGGIHPTATEACNTTDDDCDGTVDEGAQSTFYIDFDGDGYGSDAEDAESVMACGAPMGFAPNNDDCDDDQRNISPAASDGRPAACDGVDNDCDGAIDEGRFDEDGEPIPETQCDCDEGATMDCGTDEGVCTSGQQTCTAGTWSSCDGTPPASSDGCDGLDNDCDGMIDEDAGGPRRTQWCDTDGDGYGGSTEAAVCPDETACEAGGRSGTWVGNSDDCDDGDAAINPDSPEYCDTTDHDCDGKLRNGCPASASITSTTRRWGPWYGSSSGGTLQQGTCANNQVLVGWNAYEGTYSGFSGDLVVRLVVYCMSFSIDERAPDSCPGCVTDYYSYWLEPSGSLSQRGSGGTGGTLVSQLSDDDTDGVRRIITGMTGRRGARIDQLTSFYSTYTAGDWTRWDEPSDPATSSRFAVTKFPLYPEAWSAPAGGDGGSPFDYFCPDGRVATALQFRYDDNSIRGLRLGCSPLDIVPQ